MGVLNGIMSGMTKSTNITNSQIAKLTKLILSSSFPQEMQDDMIADLMETRIYEFDELHTLLEMNQLDLTQLYSYKDKDIQKRLDYIEANENM